MARPTKYSKKLAKEICKRISEGESIRTISLDERMPNASTIHLWVLEDREGFSKQYARARDIQAEVMFDEILQISDNADLVVLSGDEKKSSAYAQNQRLRVDTRKWYLSKVLPKKYGDKLDVTSGGKPIPLLNALHNNNSDKEDSGTEEKN